MIAYLLPELEHLLRILCAVICGILVGYERDNHMKMAGIRTHSIVALTAAIMMIISKYGFFDVLTSSNIRLDPSRVASGVVTAIGFLGAGVIFTKKQNITGLTTAAGIWAVVGIGMAFGAGMYFLGVTCTVCIIVLHVIFHRNYRWLRNPVVAEVVIRIPKEEDVSEIVKEFTKEEHVTIANISIIKIKEDFEIKLALRVSENHDVEEMIAVLRKRPYIKSMSI